MALGDIGAVIDTYEFETSNTFWTRILHVSGNVYAISYDVDALHGWVKTVTIADNGQITEPFIDSFEYETVWASQIDFIHIANDVYALAGIGPVGHGWINTITIAANGQITDPIIDTEWFDGANGANSNIIHISGIIYAIVHAGADDDGWLKTRTITDAGAIGAGHTDYYEYDTNQGKWPAIINIGGANYAISYAGISDHGSIKTVTISAGGAIDEPFIDEWEHDTGNALYNKIIHIAGNVYALLYTDVATDGMLKTVAIGSGGGITKSNIDTYKFDPVNSQYARILHIASQVYAVVYKGGYAPGTIKTFTIAADGQIAEPAIDTYAFESTTCLYPDIIHIAGNVYAIAYQGAGNDGFLKTLDIESTVVEAVKHLPLMGIG